MNLRRHLKRIAKLGGKATYDKYGPKYYKKISKKGVDARKKNGKKK